MNIRIFRAVTHFAAATSLSLVGFTAMAKNHVVVFRYQPQSEQELAQLKAQHPNQLTAASRSELQTKLQQINQTYIKALSAQLKRPAAQGSANPKDIKDLWLARAAVVDIGPDEVSALRTQPWVHRVIEDRRRRFINPMGDLRVSSDIEGLMDLKKEHQAKEGAPEDEVKLWGLEQTGLYTLRGIRPELTGKGVRVGIIDTGIQSRHPEFSSMVEKPIFRDFVAHLSNPYDDHGHGTHVAGTIAGVTTGYAPQVSLVVAKVFGADGSGVDSEILDAMQWMVDPDGNPKTADYPQLVNNSWGADLSGDGPFDIEQVSHFRFALESWIDLGIAPIFAAGNSGTFPNGIPGGLPEALAVGAINSDVQVAIFSSQGPNLWSTSKNLLMLLKPDVTAPGQDIISAFPGNKYAKWSGTSMATPHVTGALALFTQQFPGKNPQIAKTALLLSSQRMTTTTYGFGTIDVLRLLTVTTTRQSASAAPKSLMRSPKASKAVVF